MYMKAVCGKYCWADSAKIIQRENLRKLRTEYSDRGRNILFLLERRSHTIQMNENNYEWQNITAETNSVIVRSL